MLWSIGKYLLTSDKKDFKFSFKNLITMPFITNIAAVTIVLLNLHVYIPEIILKPIDLLGEATVPIGTFILGAILGTISLKYLPPWQDILKITIVKFVFIPVITLTILYFTDFKETNALLCIFLVVEATAAPAANIIVIVKSYGGDIKKIASLMLFSYLIAIILVPFWVAVWNIIK